MKLLIETLFSNELDFLEESLQNGSKSYRIRGIFAQAEVKNGNGRIYPNQILESQMNDYVVNKVNTKQALGELNHPTSYIVNIERASHLVEHLEMRGNDVYGTAKIIDTPCGRIVKSVLAEGVKIGISTRGVGTVNHSGYVNPDFRLGAFDIVSNPSAQRAYMDAILESKEYIIQGDEIVEVSFANMKKKLDKHGSKVVVEALRDFLKSLKGE